MEHSVEDQASTTMDYQEAFHANSDAESSSSSTSANSSSERFRFFIKHGMMKLEDGDKEHNDIKSAFLVSLGPFKHQANVVAIHKNLHSNLIGQARVEAFRIYSKAVAKKCGGDANIRFAWFGASRDEICRIISHGFCSKQQGGNGSHSYGVGIHLSPANFSISSVSSAMEDENGLRHVLLCCVILGNTEVVQPGSRQFQPSSDQFDSGVDDTLKPKRYIIWNCYMNSHILPACIISFKVLSTFRGTARFQNVPRSPYMNISSLLNILSNYLNPSKIALISKNRNEYMVNKISREEMVRRLRQIAGDELLRHVLKLCTKQKH